MAKHHMSGNARCFTYSKGKVSRVCCTCSSSPLQPARTFEYQLNPHALQQARHEARTAAQQSADRGCSSGLDILRLCAAVDANEANKSILCSTQLHAF